MNHLQRVLRDVQIAAVGLMAGAGVIEAASDVPDPVHAAAGIAVLAATAVKEAIAAGVHAAAQKPS